MVPAPAPSPISSPPLRSRERPGSGEPTRTRHHLDRKNAPGYASPCSAPKSATTTGRFQLLVTISAARATEPKKQYPAARSLCAWWDGGRTTTKALRIRPLTRSRAACIASPAAATAASKVPFETPQSSESIQPLPAADPRGPDRYTLDRESTAVHRECHPPVAADSRRPQSIAPRHERTVRPTQPGSGPGSQDARAPGGAPDSAGATAHSATDRIVFHSRSHHSEQHNQFRISDSDFGFWISTHPLEAMGYGLCTGRVFAEDRVDRACHS